MKDLSAPTAPRPSLSLEEEERSCVAARPAVMAATSTSWGLGAHKMTADISSSTPVASPSNESPIKAKR